MVTYLMFPMLKKETFKVGWWGRGLDSGSIPKAGFHYDQEKTATEWESES